MSALFGVMLLGTGLVACGGDDSSSTTNAPSTEVATSEAPATDAPAAEGVLNVPADYATIQEAVDAAVEAT